MLKSTLSTLVVAGTALLAGTTAAAQPAATPAAPPIMKSGYIETDGVRYYYEVRGEGEPLLVLHGGLGSFDMFAPVLPLLATKRQIIGVDLQGHGRTALGSRPFGLPAMGNDMAAILKALGHRQVDVFGYSMGGAVALQFAFQHPDMVRRLAPVSIGYAQDAFYPEILKMQAQVGAGMADAMKETPMYKMYMQLAPNPQDFPRLLDLMGNWMRQPYDWSAEVAKLKMPVMLAYGDSDAYRPEHIMKFYQLLGGFLKDAGWQRENMVQNRLAILPGLTHYDLFLAPELYQAVLPFLDGVVRERNWSAGK